MYTLSYSYITSRSRISLLLHATSACDITVLCPTALITNRSEEIWSILLLLLKINTLKLLIDLLDGLEIQKKLPTLMTF